MVGQRVEDFLRSFNLESGDIPKVMGLFVAAKYATVAAGVLVGLRYQPLRRLVLARSLVSRSSRPWAPQQRGVIDQSLNHARGHHPAQLGGTWAQQQQSRVLDAFSRAKEFRRDAKGRWKKAGQKLLLQKQLAHQHRKEWLTKLQARHTWHGWLSQKYWHLADALETAARKSYLFSKLSTSLGLMPKTLAVGTAEGVLLAKLALPLTAPLSFLLITLMFRPAGTLATTSAQECDDTNKMSE